MSILIKGMEMPQGCGDCPCLGGEYHGSYDNHFYCQVTDKGIGEHKPDWCPLIEVPEWIPVEEKVPEEKGNYLVVQDCWNGAEVHEAFFFRRDNDYGWFDPVEEYEKYNPTHWMPLPEPPKVDDL